jgi:hypothetical protein
LQPLTGYVETRVDAGIRKSLAASSESRVI